MLLALGASLALSWFVVLPSGAPVHAKDGADIDISLLIESRGARLLVRANGVAVRDWVGLPGSSPTGLDEAWAEELGQRLLAALNQATLLSFDGETQPLRLDAARIETAQLDRLSYFPIHGALAASVLELELWIPHSPAAKELQLAWPYFPKEAAEGELACVPLVLLAGAKRTRVQLKHSDPSYRWELPAETAPALLDVEPAPAPVAQLSPQLLAGLGLALALWLALLWRQGRRGSAALGAACALVAGLLAARSSAAELEPERAQRIFERLHTNVYRAFDSVDRSQVYDALASSVAGPLLDQIYTSVASSLELADHGGTRGWVEGLDLLSTECAEPERDGQGFLRYQVRAEWRVRARLEHSDHAHQRAEEYAARYTVAATAAGWRLLDLTILSQQRLPTPELPREE